MTSPPNPLKFMVVFHIFLYYVVKSRINHLSATVVFTCCAVALTLYWSCIRFFIFSSVSSITSFQPSTRSRYRSSDWLRSLIDMRWFCISCVSRLLVAFRVVWVWETWSRTWRVKSRGSETKSQAPPSFFCLFFCYRMLKSEDWALACNLNNGPAPVRVSFSGCLQTPSSAC